jgi:hypothetical protein
MKEGVTDIELVKTAAMTKGKRENKANGALSNNGAESVTIVIAIMLMIAFGH